MIHETTTYPCRQCASSHIVKNDKNRYGSQQYLCKACGASGVLAPKVRYSQKRKDEILRADQERPSMRGISRIFGVSRTTLANWIKRSPKST